MDCLAVTARADDPRFPKFGQVLRDGGLPQSEARRQCVHARLPFDKTAQQHQALLVRHNAQQLRRPARIIFHILHIHKFEYI